MVHVIKAVWALRPATESNGMAQQECSLSPGCCGPLDAVKNAPRSAGRPCASTGRLLTLWAEGQTLESNLTDETRLRDPAVGFDMKIFTWENPGMFQLEYYGSEVFHSLLWLPATPLPFQRLKNCFEIRHKKIRIVEMEKRAWKKILLSLLWVIWTFLSLHKFQFSSFVFFFDEISCIRHSPHRCLLRESTLSAALGNLVWIGACEKQRQTIPLHTTPLASFIAGVKQNTSAYTDWLQVIAAFAKNNDNNNKRKVGWPSHIYFCPAVPLCFDQLDFMLRPAQ